MMRSRRDEATPTREGGYATFYERPFPRRLERFFRWVAIMVALAVLSYGAGEAAPHLIEGNTRKLLSVILTYCGVAQTIGWFAYGLGLAVVGATRLTRPKTHVIDWHIPDTYERQMKITLIVFVALASNAACFGIAKALS